MLAFTIIVNYLHLILQPQLISTTHNFMCGYLTQPLNDSFEKGPLLWAILVHSSKEATLPPHFQSSLASLPASSGSPLPHPFSYSSTLSRLVYVQEFRAGIEHLFIRKWKWCSYSHINRISALDSECIWDLWKMEMHPVFWKIWKMPVVTE